MADLDTIFAHKNRTSVRPSKRDQFSERLAISIVVNRLRTSLLTRKPAVGQVGPFVSTLGKQNFTPVSPDYCYQPKDLGSCRGSIHRYYFDPKEKICKIFTYGGCNGNKNNFMSLPECQKKCIIATETDPVCMSIAKCGLHCSPCCTEDLSGCVRCNCEHIIEDNFLNCVKSPSLCPIECEVETMYVGCHVCRCDREIKLIEPAIGDCLVDLSLENSSTYRNHSPRTMPYHLVRHSNQPLATAYN
ncbi:kunitz-type protease inhibitor 1 [Trichonephila clavipes]|nr:kunitz-type protease inhibitor 1 [Trichonephila clavipes]